MGVDLHRIGFGISSGTSRTGFGTIVSFPSVVVSYPAAGTFNSWLYDVAYPIAEGGASVSPNGTTYYPSQFCDVQVKNNGSGGTYTDWATATDVQYYAWGVEIYSETGNAYISITTSCNGTQNIVGGTSTTVYNHDGTGGYAMTGGNNWYSNGTFLYSETCTYDDGTGSTYDITYNYAADGSGGYYSY